MATFFRETMLRGVGPLIAAGLQIWAGYWRLLFIRRIAIGQFDSLTTWYAIIDISLGLVGGAMIAMSLFPGQIKAKSFATQRVVIALSLLLSTIALAIKLSAALGMGRLPLEFMFVDDWAVFSGLPSLWLGITIVAIINHLKGD